MRVFVEMVFQQTVVGTASVYSHPRYDALLGVLDQIGVAVTCSLVSGAAVTLRVDLEHSNDDMNWVTKTNILGPVSISATDAVTLMGYDDLDAPNAAFVRLKITLSGSSPSAHLEVRTAANRSFVESGVRWNADFSGFKPGLLAKLPAGLSFSRASDATVQTSSTTVDTANVKTDNARVGDDGTHAGLVFEESRTNLIADARAIDGASWVAGSLVVTTPDYADGPDGTANVADRSEVQKDGYSNYDRQINATAGTYSLSQWYKAGSGGALAQIALLTDSTASVQSAGGDAPAYWQRIAVSKAHSSGDVYSNPANGQDGTGSGGITNGARDVVTDLIQLEVGKFATETVVTSGGTATRAGERLYLSSATAVVFDGRLGLEVRLQPKGSATQYGAAMTLWYIDANNYAEISESTQKITLVIGGSSTTFATALSWAAGDTVDLWVVGGGGALLSNAQYRVNDGATTDLGSSGSPASAISSGGAIDLLCNGTTKQFTSWVKRIRAYGAGGRPRWAV